MTFTAEAQKPVSERFMLVRVTPRKFVGTGTSIGGGQYTFAVSSAIKISAVTVNNINESTWAHSNGVLTVTSATNLTLSSNVVTIDHDLFFTGEKVRYTSSVSGLPDAEWLPLITSYPEFSQTMRSIADGVFSLSNSDIELISVDRWGQSLLGVGDSFSNAPVAVWVCIDSAATNRKVFDGAVSKVSYSYGRLSLNIIDSFNKLKQSSIFGSLAFIDVGQNQINAVPFTLGKSSPMTLGNGWRHVNAEGSPPGNLKHIKDGYRGVLTGPAVADKTSTTSWTLGRCIGGVKRLNFGTIIGNTLIYRINTPVNVDFNFQFYTGTNPDLVSKIENQTSYIVDEIYYIQLQNINDFNGQIGDYIPASYLPVPAAVDGGWVCGFGAGLNGSYNLAIAAQRFEKNNLSETTVSNSTTSALSLPNGVIPSMSVWVEGGDNLAYNAKGGYVALSIVPYYSLEKSGCTRYVPFTLSESNQYTLNGQTIKRVDINVPASTQMNISSLQLKFRFSPANEMTHGEALKFIVESAGMTTNASSFSQADTDLSANVSITFPLEMSSSFDSYLSACQAITSSTLGLLRLNESREVEYKVLKNPSLMAVDHYRTTDNMINGETNSLCEYQDILTRFSFENPQLFGLSEMANSGSFSVVDVAKAKQLHRVEKSKIIKHYLTNISTRKTSIAGYLSSPTVEYTLATASEDLSANLGDVVQITNNASASANETVTGIITSIDHGASKTTIKINELRGID